MKMLHMEVINSSRFCQYQYLYDVGVLDAGIGVRQLNTLLSAIDVPIMYGSTFKRNERIVGPAIEKVAEDTCRKNIQLEKRKM